MQNYSKGARGLSV